MAYKSTRRQWVKLWVNEWLDGTTRFELTAPQRLLWIDLLALAGRSRFPGLIYAGEGEQGKKVGYPLAYLAGVLQMDEVALNNALKLLEHHSHITLDEVSSEKFVIGIANWEKYQSEYLRQKTYRNVNPEKIHAKQRVNKAVKEGNLIKSGTCEQCGSSGRIEGHHPDYSKPLEVIWLCAPCHRKVTTNCMSRLPVEGEVDVEGEVEEEEKHFGVFWENYPRKVGKQVALKWWKNASPEDREQAIHGLVLWNQSEQWNRDDGKYIPHASTFLTQRRWADEPWTGAFTQPEK